MPDPSVTSTPIDQAPGASGPGAIPPTPAPAPGVADAKSNPLYIGATNFASLQKAYNPSILSQATTKDASGNYFWKQGVDINKLNGGVAPKIQPPAAPSPTTNNLPMGGSTPTPSPTSFTTPVTTSDVSGAISTAATTYGTNMSASIDALLAKQQALQDQQKQQAEANVKSISDRLTSLFDTSKQQDALQASRDLFHVQDTITQLQTIQGKIADATDALNQGLIYEQNRPVRMSLLTGRSAELKSQGIATIGALQSSAEVLKGNLDLAKAYATDTANAIKEDNSSRMDAMKTLLDLENSKLVTLTKDEKDTIDERMKNLEERNKTIDTQTQDVFDLAKTYPGAFVKGGVTFNDSRDQALAKMLPTMSSDERAKYDLDIKQKQADVAYKLAETAKAGRTGSGSGSPAPDSLSSLSDQITQMQSDNVPPNTAVSLLQKKLGRLLTTKEIAWVKADFAAKQSTNPANKPLTAPEVKTLGFDPIAHPDYVGMTVAQVSQAEKDSKAAASAAENGGRGPGFWNWTKNLVGGAK